MTPCRLALLLLSIAALHGCGSGSNTADTASDPLILSDLTDQTTGNETDQAPAETPGDSVDGIAGDIPAAGGLPTETDEPGDAQTDGDGVFRPAFADGSDEARLFDALNEIVAETILTLDELMTSGTTLSDQQNTCLGAFDPAFGQRLLAIDCDPERPLASNIRPVYVGAASLHETDVCLRALSESRVDDCVVRAAEVFVFTQFGSATFPQRPSPLSGTGVEIRYAIDGQTLTLENDDDALNGRFRCEFDLTSGEALTPDDCNDVLGSIVDRLAQLQEAG